MLTIELKVNGSRIDRVDAVNQGKASEWKHKYQVTHKGKLIGYVTHNQEHGALVLAEEVLNLVNEESEEHKEKENHGKRSNKE